VVPGREPGEDDGFPSRRNTLEHHCVSCSRLSALVCIGEGSATSIRIVVIIEDAMNEHHSEGYGPGLEQLLPSRVFISAGALFGGFVALAVLVGAHWTPLLIADHDTDLAAHNAVLTHGVLLAAAWAATAAGSPFAVELIAVVVVLGLVITSRVRAALYVATSVIVDFAVETGIKHLLVRPRPVLSDPITHAHGFSFPSGHAGGSATLCVSLLVLVLPRCRGVARAAVVTLAVLAVAAVATSRVLLGVHYPSDVLGGVLLGTACALGLAGLLGVTPRDTGAQQGT
jgi:undecaprenyl-diphosphatase